MSFIVQHCVPGCYLGQGVGFVHHAREAQLFETVASAKAAGEGSGQILAVSYVLRWYVGKTGSQYSGANEFAEKLIDADRYDSAESARASADASVLFGAGGPSDTVGWKVRRVLTKVKA